MHDNPPQYTTLRVEKKPHIGESFFSASSGVLKFCYFLLLALVVVQLFLPFFAFFSQFFGDEGSRLGQGSE